MICKHIKKHKISFWKFLKFKNQGKNIYFYCEKCQKLFIAKKQRELTIDISLILFVICNLTISLRNISNLPYYIEILICIAGIVFLNFILLYIQWKKLDYDEININKIEDDSK